MGATCVTIKNTIYKILTLSFLRDSVYCCNLKITTVEKVLEVQVIRVAVYENYGNCFAHRFAKILKTKSTGCNADIAKCTFSFLIIYFCNSIFHSKVSKH